MKEPTPKRKLFALARRQQGLFTARQAAAAGYDPRNHSYHVGRKNWIRERRGIYRLSRFPRTPEADHVLWSLWSMDESLVPQGVFSYESALAIHGVSDALPSKVHLSVPRDFGTHKVRPPLVLHRVNLAEKDIEPRDGFRVTTPLRTLVDCVMLGTVPGEFVGQALSAFLRDGRVTSEAAEEHAELRPFLVHASESRDAEPMYLFLKRYFAQASPRQEISDENLRHMAKDVSQGLVGLFQLLGDAWQNVKVMKRRKTAARLLTRSDRVKLREELGDRIKAQGDAGLRSLWDEFTADIPPGRRD